MKKNKLFIVFIIFILISCNQRNFSSLYKIKKIIFLTDNSNNLSGKLNIASKDFIEYRKKDINNYIKTYNLKDFIIEDFFNYDHYIGGIRYNVFIIKGDSVFSFNHNLKKIEIDNLKRKNEISNLYFFRRSNSDSIFITKNQYQRYNTNEYIESIFNFVIISEYKDGKLMQITSNDSVVYKKKGSKMKVDLNSWAWHRDNGNICIEKGNSIDCEDKKYKNCIRTKTGYIVSCDSLK